MLQIPKLLYSDIACPSIYPIIYIMIDSFGAELDQYDKHTSTHYQYRTLIICCFIVLFIIYL